LDGLHGAGDAVFVWRQSTCPSMQASSSLISLIFRENFWGLLSLGKYFSDKLWQNFGLPI